MLRGLIAGLDRELDMLLNDEYAAITREEEVKNVFLILLQLRI